MPLSKEKMAKLKAESRNVKPKRQVSPPAERIDFIRNELGPLLVADIERINLWMEKQEGNRVSLGERYENALKYRGDK